MKTVITRLTEARPIARTIALLCTKLRAATNTAGQGPGGTAEPPGTKAVTDQ